MFVRTASSTRHRRLLSGVVTFALLWVHLAVAAYACASALGGAVAAPAVAQALPSTTGAEGAGSGGAPPDCAGHADDADPLCFRHCHPGDESGPVQVPAIPGRTDHLLAVAAAPACSGFELPRRAAPAPDAQPPPNIAFCSLQC